MCLEIKYCTEHRAHLTACYSPSRVKNGTQIFLPWCYGILKQSGIGAQEKTRPHGGSNSRRTCVSSGITVIYTLELARAVKRQTDG